MDTLTNGSTSLISQTLVPAAAVPVPQSSLDDNRAQFKSPQALPRGRQRARQSVTARANSADNSLQSLTSSELASGTESRTEKSRSRRRAKSAAQDGAVGNITAHHDNVDTPVSLNSADNSVQSVVHSYPLQPAGSSQSVVKTRRRRRTKSATLDGAVENDVAATRRDNVGNSSPSNSAENSAQSNVRSHQSRQAGSSQQDVVPRRRRRTMSAAPSDTGTRDVRGSIFFDPAQPNPPTN